MKNVTNAMRAHILTAAVPYIKQYTDQYVVVKYGGNAMIDEELKKSVMKDLLLPVSYTHLTLPTILLV